MLLRKGAVLLCCALSLAVVVVLSGCADQGSDDPMGVEGQGEVIDSKRYDGPVPDFSGPHAEEFRESYRNAKTDIERSILGDEKITEQEVEELKGNLDRCLFSYGRRLVWHDRDSFTYRSLSDDLVSDEELEAYDKETKANICGFTSQVNIISLYWSIRSNPENEDIAAIMARCMVREGLRSKEYTARDYEEDFVSGKINEDTEADPGFNAKFSLCNADPLGLMS